MVSEAQSQVQQPVSAEEEALKRNTDCVYFLASPLTCKKGSECEYRHSEIARVNPRDCWYWVNSNCLNPKCAFRHPPLEGFLGAQTTTSTGPSIPQTQTTTTPYVANVPGKQGVPCVFFQKGYCLKGDWCPFLHVPNSSSNKTSQVGAQLSAAEPLTIKKATVGLEKSIQEKKAQTIPVDNSGKAKSNAEVETAILKNGFASDRRVQQASVFNDVTGYRNILPISNGTQVNWPNRVQHSHLLDEPQSTNSKDEEEVSREPSPGFDVLVDDEGRDSDYYLGEDRHGMSREHEMNGYDIGHSNDYADLDDEIYQEPIGYDSRERYAWEQQRVSSERILDGSYVQRRQHTRNDSRDRVDESDLRHRLSRHKKHNGLRSVISRVTRDMDAQDQSHQGSYESRNARDNDALSSRLRGRIRLPSKSSSPTNGNINRLPVRTSVAPHQGRIRDRIKGRVDDSYDNGLRARRGSDFTRDHVRDGNNFDFSGPKSLAELKNKKIVEPREHHIADKNQLGKRKHSMFNENQESGLNRSFEGPKSLEEILKRKRGESSGTTNEHHVEGKTHKEENDPTDKEFNNFTPFHKNKDENSNAFNMVSKSTTTLIEAAEEGQHVDHGADLESEALEQKEVDYHYDYEQTGGDDYEYYEGENGDAVDEYVEDEDDDFAKKMGVVYS